MSARSEQRKLSATIFTDMVGWSALAQRKELLEVGKFNRHYATM